MNQRPWYQDRLRGAFLDFHLPDLPGALERLDPKAVAERFAESRVNVAYIHAKDNQGLYHYATKVGQRHPGIGERDILREFLDALHARDIRVVAYVNGSRDRRMFEKHPEWRQKWNDGTDRGLARAMPDWDNMCFNSPYADLVISTLDEIGRNYDVDGFWLDRIDYGGAADRYCCACTFCRAEFAQATSRELPPAGDRDSASWQAFVRWRWGVVNRYLARCRQAVKEARPEAALTFNYFGPFDAVSAWLHGQHVEESAQYADFLAPEIHFEREGYLAFSLFARLIRGAAGRPAVLGTFRFGGDYDFAVKPTRQLEAECMDVVANGAGVMVVDQVYPDGTLEPQVYRSLREVYTEIERREEWLLGTTPVPYAALLYSHSTRHFHVRRSHEEYQLSFLGTYRAMLEAYFPFEVITDRHLASDGPDLAAHRVLVLPAAACLSDEQVQRLRRFVAGGGGLVTTYDTSMHGPSGEERNGFGLSDVLGVASVRSGTEPLMYMHPVGPSGLLAEVPQAGPWVHRGKYLLVEATPAVTVAACWVEPARGFGTVTGRPHLDPPGQITNFPAVAVHRFGAGRVVYFAGDVGEAYARWGHPVLRQALAAAIQWAAGEAPPLQVKAPPCVEGTMYRQNHGGVSRYVAHLVNYQPGLARSIRISHDRFIG